MKAKELEKQEIDAMRKKNQEERLANRKRIEETRMQNALANANIRKEFNSLKEQGIDGINAMKQSNIQNIHERKSKERINAYGRMQLKKEEDSLSRNNSKVRLKVKFVEIESQAKKTEKRIAQLEKLEDELLNKIKTTANHH